MKALAIVGLVALAIPCSANAQIQHYPIQQPYPLVSPAPIPQTIVPAQPYQPSPGFLYPSVAPDNSNSVQMQHLLGGYMRQNSPGYQ